MDLPGFAVGIRQQMVKDVDDLLAAPDLTAKKLGRRL